MLTCFIPYKTTSPALLCPSHFAFSCWLDTAEAAQIMIAVMHCTLRPC